MINERKYDFCIYFYSNTDAFNSAWNQLNKICAIINLWKFNGRNRNNPQDKHNNSNNYHDCLTFIAKYTIRYIIFTREGRVIVATHKCKNYCNLQLSICTCPWGLFYNIVHILLLYNTSSSIYWRNAAPYNNFTSYHTSTYMYIAHLESSQTYASNIAKLDPF